MKKEPDPRFYRILEEKDMGLYSRVVELHDDGVFAKATVRYIANDDSQEAQEAASKASFEAAWKNPPKHDAITSPAARAETLKELEEIRSFAGYSAMREAAKKCARDFRKSKGVKAQLEAFRVRDEAFQKAGVNLDAIVAVQQAISYLKRLPVEIGDSEEDAYRAGFYHAKALALLRGPVAKNGRRMNQKDAAKQTGRIRRKSNIRSRFEDAVRDWKEEYPDAPDRDFWPWFSKEAADYSLDIDEGETPQKVDTWNLFLEGTNEQASGRTGRGWLKEMRLQ